jgi:hypothetical protein
MNTLARLGDPEDQASSLFQEGRELATRSGNLHVLSEVLHGFGFLRLLAGAVTEAEAPLVESVQRADETENIGLRVAVRYGLCDAYCFAGRLRDCLAVADQGLGLARGDLRLGADRIGFSPSLGLSCWRGIALVLTGHPREGAAELDRVTELGRAHQQLHPVWIAHAQHVFGCMVLGEEALALAHGREAVDVAERTSHQVGRVWAYLSLGLANALNRTWRDALGALEHSLAVGRERRVRVWEGYVLAAMAQAHLALGDCSKALALVEEATLVSRGLGTGFCDFAVLQSRVSTLREARGAPAAREIEAALAEAEAWIERSGAKSYEPFLQLERAELARLTGDEVSREHALREAHRLFVEIGAPARAEQVAREIGG